MAAATSLRAARRRTPCRHSVIAGGSARGQVAIDVSRSTRGQRAPQVRHLVPVTQDDVLDVEERLQDHDQLGNDGLVGLTAAPAPAGWDGRLRGVPRAPRTCPIPMPRAPRPVAGLAAVGVALGLGRLCFPLLVAFGMVVLLVDGVDGLRRPQDLLADRTDARSRHGFKVEPESAPVLTLGDTRLTLGAPQSRRGIRARAHETDDFPDRRDRADRRDRGGRRRSRCRAELARPDPPGHLQPHGGHPLFRLRQAARSGRPGHRRRLLRAALRRALPAQEHRPADLRRAELAHVCRRDRERRALPPRAQRGGARDVRGRGRPGIRATRARRPVHRGAAPAQRVQPRRRVEHDPPDGGQPVGPGGGPVRAPRPRRFVGARPGLSRARVVRLSDECVRRRARVLRSSRAGRRRTRCIRSCGATSTGS